MTDRKTARVASPRTERADGTVQNDASLGRDIQSKIGEQLRSIYDDVISQGVPDRFAELLKRLEDEEGRDKS